MGEKKRQTKVTQEVMSPHGASQGRKNREKWMRREEDTEICSSRPARKYQRRDKNRNVALKTLLLTVALQLACYATKVQIDTIHQHHLCFPKSELVI